MPGHSRGHHGQVGQVADDRGTAHGWHRCRRGAAWSASAQRWSPTAQCFSIVTLAVRVETIWAIGDGCCDVRMVGIAQPMQAGISARFPSALPAVMLSGRRGWHGHCGNPAAHTEQDHIMTLTPDQAATILKMSEKYAHRYSMADRAVGDIGRQRAAQVNERNALTALTEYLATLTH